MPCRWDAPDGSRRVILNNSVVEQVRKLAINAFLELPRRGREIGGLLLGHFEGGEHPVAYVEACEEIPSEHRYGPSYILSEEDRRVLEKVLALRNPEGSLPVIGFYRSYTRREPELNQADRELLERYFPGEPAVFLLIEPRSATECLASFVFREGGDLPAQSPYSRFRFDPEALASVDAVRARTAVHPAAPATPAVPAVQAAPQLPPARHPRAVAEDEPAPAVSRRRRGVLLPLVACVALSIAAAAIYVLWQIARQPQWAQLHLDATASPGRIELTWDTAAAPVVLASSAAIMVNDGAGEKTIRLTGRELRQGRYEYRPEHANILFRMALYGARIKPWADSLRVVALAPPPLKLPVIPAPAAKPAPAAEADRKQTAEPHEAVATPAEALREVQPAIPEGIRSRIDSRVVIPVELRIDRRGRVISAVSPEKGSSVDRYLAQASVKAARAWRFKPAKAKGGAPVESRKTIEFAFRPQ
jgi:TonB family protein